MNTRKQMLIAAALVLVAAASVVAYSLVAQDQPAAAGEHDHSTMTAGAGAGSNAPVSMSAEQASRIGVTYAIAERGPLDRLIRTVATVTYDETRVVNVSPKIEGWIEQLYVNFTGAPVRRGQALMALYSPMLVSAQEELILARRLLDSNNSASARELLEAARRRLLYWDVAASDVARIEATLTPQKTVTLRAPSSGIVVEKMATQGARVMPGMDVFRIADLSTVWVEGEVFEKDLSLVKLGGAANIAFDAYPGQRFTGRVTYVYPTVTQETRTGRIRVALANPGMRFKPGMYANIEFTVPVHMTGLHVPRTAVLSTGTRSIVFVKHADGSLMPHTVTLGLAAGDHVEILSGIEEGQVVVASANFLVDAEANLGAALKAMPAAPPESTAPAAAHKH